MHKTLKEHRIEQMQTYRDLADASGVAVTTIMALERGTRRAHFATMLAVAGALGLNVRDIAEFDLALEGKLTEAA